jgi:MFS family permease
MQSLWYSFGFAAANALSVSSYGIGTEYELTAHGFSPVAYWYIDRKGRRFLLLVSLVLMVPLLLATGFSSHIPKEPGRSRAVAAFLIIYTAVYSPGAGVSD